LPAYQGGAPLNDQAAAAPNAAQTKPAGARP